MWPGVTFAVWRATWKRSIPWLPLIPRSSALVQGEGAGRGNVREEGLRAGPTQEHSPAWSTSVGSQTRQWGRMAPKTQASHTMFRLQSWCVTWAGLVIKLLDAIQCYTAKCCPGRTQISVYIGTNLTPEPLQRMIPQLGTVNPNVFLSITLIHIRIEFCAQLSRYLLSCEGDLPVSLMLRVLLMLRVQHINEDTSWKCGGFSLWLYLSSSHQSSSTCTEVIASVMNKELTKLPVIKRFQRDFKLYEAGTCHIFSGKTFWWRFLVFF